MFRKGIYVFILILLLSGCGSQGSTDNDAAGSGGRNPKGASVIVENEVVTIKLPGHTSYFWLEKAKDDSVQYDTLYFKFDSVEGKFFYKTNLADWQPVVLDNNMVEMGQVKIAFGDTEITITYPSGTWAFP